MRKKDSSHLYYQDWLERHDRLAEAEAMECVDPPELKPPPEKDQLECRLCEDFPVFNKNFDFHKHLADIHFRTQLNNDLPQVRMTGFIIAGKVSNFIC